MDEKMKALMTEFVQHYVDEYHQFKNDEPFIISAAKKEFPKAEYVCVKLLLENENFLGVLRNFNMRLENENSINRYTYYQAIKQYFAKEAAALTLHFQNKYKDKAELISLEIIMMILTKRFYTPHFS